MSVTEAPEVTTERTVLDENWPVLDNDQSPGLCHLVWNGEQQFLCGAEFSMSAAYYMLPESASHVEDLRDKRICDCAKQRCWPCVTEFRKRGSS